VNGPVTTAYAMSAPADQTALVSPLTTLVQQTVATTGATTAEAAQSVQAATGITVSLFQDYTAVAAPTDGSIDPGTVARMVVVTTQQQATVVAAALGTSAIDGQDNHPGRTSTRQSKRRCSTSCRISLRR
jgi:hypothetical protein